MTRRGDASPVTLSVSDWIGIWAVAMTLVIALVGAGWGFTLSINGRLSAVEARVQSLEQRMTK